MFRTPTLFWQDAATKQVARRPFAYEGQGQPSSRVSIHAPRIHMDARNEKRIGRLMR